MDLLKLIRSIWWTKAVHNILQKCLPHSIGLRKAHSNLATANAKVTRGRNGYRYYRLHPKDWEGNVFTGVCLLTGGRGNSLVRSLSGGTSWSSLCLGERGYPLFPDMTWSDRTWIRQSPGQDYATGGTPLAVTQEDCLVLRRCEVGLYGVTVYEGEFSPFRLSVCPFRTTR